MVSLFLVVAIIAGMWIILILYGRCHRMYNIIRKYEEVERDSENRNLLLWTALMVSTMALSAKNRDYEQFTHLYNRLYFWGVPRRTLDDSMALDEFVNGCIEGRYNVLKGDSPYKYRFEEKEGVNETRA